MPQVASVSHSAFPTSQPSLKQPVSQLASPSKLALQPVAFIDQSVATWSCQEVADWAAKHNLTKSVVWYFTCMLLIYSTMFSFILYNSVELRVMHFKSDYYLLLLNVTFAGNIKQLVHLSFNQMIIQVPSPNIN